MNFYLSSYKFGNNFEEIKNLINPSNKKILFISNALDFSNDTERRKTGNNKEISILNAIGLEVEELDLRDYFGKEKELELKVKEFGGVWIRGGNSFILRQAMYLSGFDKIIVELNNKNIDFLYAGYSAATCILAPSMKGLDTVDNPSIFPYKEIQHTIYEGLNILDYVIMPHYNSDHSESNSINKEIEYCKNNNIKYEPLADGEEIIIINKEYNLNKQI